MEGLDWNWLHVTVLPSLIAFVYVWRRLIRPLQLPPPVYALALTCFALLSASVPVVLLAEWWGVMRVPRWQLFALVCWTGTLLTLCVFTLVLDAVRFSLEHFMHDTINPERRVFIQRTLSACAALAGPMLCGEALREGLHGPEIADVDIALTRLPTGMDGFVVVQLSDLHIAHAMRRSYVEDVVQKTMALRPDLIVLTGDIADGPLNRLSDVAAPLADLHAPAGVYAVTGNHEYYHNVDAWLQAFDGMGIHTLRNERVAIGDTTASFDLAGIDDISAHLHHPHHRADLARALAGRDPSRELVLLAHQPKAIYAAASANVGLMLAGHTHGGQIWPMGMLIHLVQPYVRGWAQHGPTQIYVSRGTGYGGPPMRLAVPAEITRLTLRAATV